MLRALRTLRALAAAADVERAAPAGGAAGRAPCGAPRGRHRLPAALTPLAGSAPPRGLSARPRDAGGRCRPGPRPGGALGSARPPRPVAPRGSAGRARGLAAPTNMATRPPSAPRARGGQEGDRRACALPACAAPGRPARTQRAARRACAVRGAGAANSIVERTRRYF